jgi:predicted ATPase
VGPSDVGFGIGQLLPIIVQGLLARGRVVCVEQPEIHLHPRLQAHVSDFLIKTSGAGRETDRRAPRTQWIVETHSEAMILRLQRRMREGAITPNDVSVLYVRPGPTGSEIVPLRLAEDGTFIDEWPSGFFEERFDELFPEERGVPF